MTDSDNTPRPSLISINRLIEQDKLNLNIEIKNYNAIQNDELTDSCSFTTISNNSEISNNPEISNNSEIINNPEIHINSQIVTNSDVSNNLFNLNQKLIGTHENQEMELIKKIKFHRYLIFLLIFQLIFISSISYLFNKYDFCVKLVISNLLEITCLLIILAFGFIIISCSLEIQLMKKYKYTIYIIHLLYITFISYIVTVKYNTNVIIISCIISIIILFCNMLAIKEILFNCTNICFILCVFSFMFIFSGFVHIFKLGLNDIQLLYINIFTILYVWYMTYNVKLLSANTTFSHNDYIICSVYIYYNFINIALKKIAILCN